MNDIDDIRAAIRAALERGRPSMREVAQATDLSVRTMQRHLGAQGTTYSRLLTDIRQQGACKMLRETDMPLAAIAAALGFSELSSFTRAFGQWKGLAPSRYRHSALRPKGGNPAADRHRAGIERSRGGPRLGERR